MSNFEISSPTILTNFIENSVSLVEKYDSWYKLSDYEKIKNNLNTFTDYYLYLNNRTKFDFKKDIKLLDTVSRDSQYNMSSGINSTGIMNIVKGINTWDNNKISAYLRSVAELGSSISSEILNSGINLKNTSFNIPFNLSALIQELPTTSFDLKQGKLINNEYSKIINVFSEENLDLIDSLFENLETSYRLNNKAPNSFITRAIALPFINLDLGNNFNTPGRSEYIKQQYTKSLKSSILFFQEDLKSNKIKKSKFKEEFGEQFSQSIGMSLLNINTFPLTAKKIRLIIEVLNDISNDKKQKIIDKDLIKKCILKSIYALDGKSSSLETALCFSKREDWEYLFTYIKNMNLRFNPEELEKIKNVELKIFKLKNKQSELKKFEKQIGLKAGQYKVEGVLNKYTLKLINLNTLNAAEVMESIKNLRKLDLNENEIEFFDKLTEEVMSKSTIKISEENNLIAKKEDFTSTYSNSLFEESRQNIAKMLESRQKNEEKSLNTSSNTSRFSINFSVDNKNPEKTKPAKQKRKSLLLSIFNFFSNKKEDEETIILKTKISNKDELYSTKELNKNKKPSMNKTRN